MNKSILGKFLKFIVPDSSKKMKPNPSMERKNKTLEDFISNATAIEVLPTKN